MNNLRKAIQQAAEINENDDLKNQLMQERKGLNFNLERMR